MKRAEKIALLAKVVQGQITPRTKEQLRQTLTPGGMAIILRPGQTDPGPDDEVSFHHNGRRHTMPYRDVPAFTRYDPLTVVLLPDNGRGEEV